jgi:hypothetical protein
MYRLGSIIISFNRQIGQNSRNVNQEPEKSLMGSDSIPKPFFP